MLATRELPARSDLTSEAGAFEPSVDVAPDGTIYVTAPEAPDKDRSLLWVSHDGGASFERIPWADPETGVSNLPVGFEGDVGVDAAGTVYRVDTTNAGTTVARSTDSGRTWELRNANTFLVPGGDRPWAVGGAEDQVVVAWTQPPSDGLRRMVVAVSNDGGLTFPVQTEVVPCAAFPDATAPVDDRFNPPAQTGDPAVAPDGTIYMSVNCEGHGVEVHRSTDGGGTFEAAAVRESAAIPPDFTPAAVDQAGNVYVTWTEHRNGTSAVYYAASTDGGETWGDPVTVSVQGGANMMPWIEAREEGRVAVAYYGAPGHPGAPHEVDENASWFPLATEVRAATTPEPSFFHARITDTVVAEGAECGAGDTCPGGVDSTLWDYLGVDLGPEGRVHAVWSTNHEDRPRQVSWGVAEAGLEVAP